MLYSIGYQKMKDADDLVAALRSHNIDTLVDVRSKPYGRKFAFNQSRLSAALSAVGIAYFWVGNYLGGFAKIQEADIARLAEWQKGKVACLMCMEANPDQCHRKYEIGRRLEAYGVEVIHLPLVTPAAVQASLF
ncbi:DUF488 domain-containing protein [Desulfarculus baarsii]